METEEQSSWALWPVEYRICQFPFHCDSSLLKAHEVPPALLRTSALFTAIVTRTDNMGAWNIYIAFVQSLFIAQ